MNYAALLKLKSADEYFSNYSEEFSLYKEQEFSLVNKTVKTGVVAYAAGNSSL